MKEKFILFLILCLSFILLAFNTFFSKQNSTPPEVFLELQNPTPFLEKTTEEKSMITLVAIGDVMLGRSVNAKMKAMENFSYPFLKTASFLKQADLVFINLESPFFEPCPTTNTGMIFCADPKAIEGLVFAGIDIVNLANNHIKNYGQEGVLLTKKLLKQEKITPLGPEENFVVKNIKGTSFGFLGFDLTGSFNKERIIQKVKEEQKKVDILIVSFHWGVEYAQKPSSWQKELAHQVAEAGADLILGHHPHVVQKVETYQGVPIVYSLGNFIFDQPWSEETRRGLIGVFSFQNKKLTKKEFKNINIKDFCQPEFEN